MSIKDYKLFCESNNERNEVINYVISKLEGISNFPVDKSLLKELIEKLNSVKIKPVDIIAAYKTDDSKLQKQYLIDGPSAPGGGGHGALKDLKNIIDI